MSDSEAGDDSDRLYGGTDADILFGGDDDGQDRLDGEAPSGVETDWCESWDTGDNLVSCLIEVRGAHGAAEQVKP